MAAKRPDEVPAQRISNAGVEKTIFRLLKAFPPRRGKVAAKRPDEVPAQRISNAGVGKAIWRLLE